MDPNINARSARRRVMVNEYAARCIVKGIKAGNGFAGLLVADAEIGGVGGREKRSTEESGEGLMALLFARGLIQE